MNRELVWQHSYWYHEIGQTQHYLYSVLTTNLNLKLTKKNKLSHTIKLQLIKSIPWEEIFFKCAVQMESRGEEEPLWDKGRKIKSQSNVITVSTPHSDFHSEPLGSRHGHKPAEPCEALCTGFPQNQQTCLIQYLRSLPYCLSQSFLTKSLTVFWWWLNLCC